MMKNILLITLALAVFLSACQPSIALSSNEVGLDSSGLDASEVAAPQENDTALVQSAGQGSSVDFSLELREDDPPMWKSGVAISSINPLTGLLVENPENLLLPPALVSVTNFPVTARPQAGLSFSPIVFELYIGEGMTRFLAVFYGDYPRASLPDQGESVADDLTAGMPQPVVGPVRSGRLPYEYLRQLYNGFIVMASAYSKVAAQLNDYVNVYGSDSQDVNSALMPVEQLEEVARANQQDLGEMNLSGMSFDAALPENGKPAPSLWIFFSHLNQVFWRYDVEDGSYHRWQDNADGATFVEQTDRLNGQPLTFENVIVLFVEHEVQGATLIDLGLLYVKRGKALLFRDGVMQEIYWTTISEEYERTTGRLRPIRYIDSQGNPISLKPGQTWVELIPSYDVYWETVNSEKYHVLASGRSKGSGYWAVYFKLDA